MKDHMPHAKTRQPSVEPLFLTLGIPSRFGTSAVLWSPQTARPLVLTEHGFAGR